jgi:4a-hydroxytetrahydrobiopterin dehydratase
MQKLSEHEIQTHLNTLSGWRRDGDAIKKEWKFQDFKEAMQFINKIADLAEAQNHHPELFNVYNRVTLRFTTHDAGGLTEKDIEIARAIEGIDALR